MRPTLVVTRALIFEAGKPAVRKEVMHIQPLCQRTVVVDTTVMWWSTAADLLPLLLEG